MDAGRFADARLRLEALDGSNFLWNGVGSGEFEYRLGVCRWRAGSMESAAEALARVPFGSALAADAAVLLSETRIDAGRWSEAEWTLDVALMRKGPNLHEVRLRLDRLYRMEARFEDAAEVLRKAWADAPDPVRVLRSLWRTERGTPPYDAIAQALATAYALKPDDLGVLLGKARLATQTGRLDEADRWLKACEAARTPPDPAALRARLDWARAAHRPDAAAGPLRALSTTELASGERLAWRAWFASYVGDADAERAAVAALLRLDPRNPAWLSRAASLASAAEAARLRVLKAEVDDALDAYTQAMAAPGKIESATERAAMGRLAEAAGRPADAFAWYTLALRADPAATAARESLAGLGATRSEVPPGPDGPDPWTLVEWHPPRRNLETDAVPTFRDDAKTAGLVHTFRNGETPIRQMPVALGGGVGLIDYDGDGFLDVYALQGGPFPPESATPDCGDRLFRNRGDGTFEDVTAKAGLSQSRPGYSLGVAVGDVDGDGRPDLFVTRWRSYALYRNIDNKTFEDVTTQWGLDGDRDWPTSAAFADLDGDGDLDLYVCHYVEWDEKNPRLCRNPATNGFMSCNPKTCPSRPDHLFRNDGGRFTDVSSEAGITSADKDGRGLGVVAADLDEDGKVDLFVANDKSANFLFRNLGGMRFEEVAHAAGVAGSAEGGYQAGMGVDCGDLDGDGRPDVVVTNYYGESTSYFHNEGGGSFSDHTGPSGLGGASRLRLGFGVALFDANNDGRLDVFTANGHTDDLGDVPYRMPVQLLLGAGGGRLRDVTASAGPALGVARLGRGLAAGDLDNDGKTDVLVVGQNEPLALLRNVSDNAGHWLTFRLEGGPSNRDGVGAVVTVKAGGRTTVVRRTGGGGYQSAGDPRSHVGLGAATRADDVEVRWPSGRVDRFRDLPADEIYVLTEGAAPRREGGTGDVGSD